MIRTILTTTTALIALGLAAPAMAADDTMADSSVGGVDAQRDPNLPGTAYDVREFPEADKQAKDGEFTDGEFEGMTYGDMRDRTVYSADNTEVGRVVTVYENEDGEVAGLIVAGTGDYEDANRDIYMPIDRVRRGQGDDADLYSDVKDTEMDAMFDIDPAGQGAETEFDVDEQ